jgi:hypothetical protein
MGVSMRKFDVWKADLGPLAPRAKNHLGQEERHTSLKKLK